MYCDPNQLELDLDLPRRDERRKLIPVPVRREDAAGYAYEPQVGWWRTRRSSVVVHRRLREVAQDRRSREDRLPVRRSTYFSAREAHIRRLMEQRRVWPGEVPVSLTRQSGLGGRLSDGAAEVIRVQAHLLDAPAWVPGPRYESLDEAPQKMVDWAIEEKLPWVQRYVYESCPHGTPLGYALIHARDRGIPACKVPAPSTLRKWAHQYRAYGLLGLVPKARRPIGSAGGSSRQEADHG